LIVMPTAASAKAATHRTLDEIGQRDGVTARNVTAGGGALSNCSFAGAGIGSAGFAVSTDGKSSGIR
jgi:hypothetical protein